MSVGSLSISFIHGTTEKKTHVSLKYISSDWTLVYNFSYGFLWASYLSARERISKYKCRKKLQHNCMLAPWHSSLYNQSYTEALFPKLAAACRWQHVIFVGSSVYLLTFYKGCRRHFWHLRGQHKGCMCWISFRDTGGCNLNYWAYIFVQGHKRLSLTGCCPHSTAICIIPIIFIECYQ